LAENAFGNAWQTQQVLDFCAEKGIAADIKLIHPRELNHIMVTLAKNAAQIQRFVIDIAALATVKHQII
jgi:alcohol dehydrogenase (NADP+)